MPPPRRNQDWNSFQTIGDETGYRKQPVTWVHYTCMLIFWPVAAVVGLPLAARIAMGRFGMFGVPGFFFLFSGGWNTRQLIETLSLAGGGFIAGVAMCIHMYRGEQREKMIRELQAKIAAEAAAKAAAPPHPSHVQESLVITGTSEASDEIERTIAASRRRSK